MESLERREVARIIAQQLGGAGALRMMIGATEVAPISTFDGHPGLRVRYSARALYNEFVVALKPSDTYRVTFARLRGGRAVAVQSLDDVYAEQLRETVERVTGLTLAIPAVRWVTRE